LSVSVADLYWIAPEMLRQDCQPYNGTPKADVYSFAIIMRELLFSTEAGPYHDINLPPKGAHTHWSSTISIIYCTYEDIGSIQSIKKFNSSIN